MSLLIEQSQAELERNLDNTVKLLSQGQLYTVAQMSSILGVCKVSIYAWLRRLEKRGYAFHKQKISDFGTGPKPIAYAIVQAP